MQKQFKQTLVAALLAGMFAPAFAAPADADLMKRIDSLSKTMEQMAKEMDTLKAQVKASNATATKAADEVQKVADKSTGRWLTIGGDYQFRVDNLSGETKTFTDVNATFMNAQNKMQGDFFGNPSTTPGTSSFFGAPQAGSMSTAGALSALMGFSNAMQGVKTYQDARTFVTNPMNGGFIQGIGGFAVTVPAYKPKNETLFTNRFNLDLNGKVAQDVSITAKLSMYKIWGSQNEGALTNAGSAPFFADRVGVFDGTLSRVPSNSYLNVDRVYATWSNIADQDMWFSVGRRPSTQGTPSNLKLNTARPGSGGIPSLLVDYAFDGLTLGYAPDIDSLPGSYGKICWGRGFEAGYSTPSGNSLKDTDMLGLAVVAIDTDPLRVWLQWNRGMNIFDAPVMNGTYFGNTNVKANLGDIDWYGIGAMGTMKKVGAGDLNWFVDIGASVTHPNNNVSAQFGFQGLLTGGFFNPETPTDKTGGAIWAGIRYDLPSKLKLGLEYNHGSKNWITFAPASGDMWTTKAGTRGEVYEAYVIKELDLKPISSPQAKTFVRVGVQYYDFKYSGSNNWVGAPVEISTINGQMMTTTPLENAFNAYATAEVKF